MEEKISNRLNISAQCRKYGLSLWQCPQFLFLVMGILIIAATISFYLIGSRYIADPEMVALIVIVVTLVLLVIAYVITRNFERLAEVSRMKSEFVNIVSHQLRAPLTNLKWAVDFLALGEDNITREKKEEYLDGLAENVGRMSELVDDLLIVSRLEQNSVPLRKKEVSLETIIRDFIFQFKAVIEASNIEIKFHCQEKLPKAYIDPSQIKLIIENLIDNAIRYSKGGDIEIWLGKRDNNFFFEIKDSGVGIPMADQKYIFQKFFRSENALKEKTKGSGLGLYIVKSIIEKNKGEIWFKSEEGKGTSFFFTLPIR